MGKIRNIKTLIALVAILLLAGIGFNACGIDGVVILEKGPHADQGVKEETTPPLGTEIDNIPGTPEAGDIVKNMTNPVTGARAYEEMQPAPEKNDPNAVLSRVIVDYKGKKTQMQPSSAIIDFSPDGRFLLYIHDFAPKNQDGIYLYNVETGKTQELAPSVPKSDPRYIPGPEARFMPYTEGPKWGNGTISYEKGGKTWTLTYKEE